MGCLKLYQGYEEKGILIEMVKDSKKKPFLKRMTKWIKKHGSELAVGVIVAIICAVGGYAVSYVRALPTLKSLSEQINEMSTETSALADSYYEDSTELSSEIEEMKIQIAELNGFKDTILGIKTLNNSSDESRFMNDVSVEANDIPTVGAGQLEADTYVGTDSSGVDYTAEELIGETVLISYKEDDKEVYFLGQYNENYHWDGYCVTNAYYENGTLYGICESNFEDGNRLDYVSFYQDGDEWIYANRQLVQDENVGITINYRIENSKQKNFTTTNVRVTDILYADNYIEEIDKDITKFYSGNTVESIFEDSTGDAYEVKYDADGTVRMLYVGRFAKGYCEDATGEAFSIIYSDKYEAYFYNTGKFSKGNAEVHSKDPISVEEINEIVESYSFDCELHWKQ